MIPVSGLRSSAGAKRGLALDEKRYVDAPYASCKNYNNPILVPDGDAGKFHKHPNQKGKQRTLGLTYGARSIVKKRKVPGSQRPREEGEKTRRVISSDHGACWKPCSQS